MNGRELSYGTNHTQPPNTLRSTQREGQESRLNQDFPYTDLLATYCITGFFRGLYISQKLVLRNVFHE